MKSKMNLKLDLSMVNTILMVIVLILVIVACVKRYRENFDVCHIPCDADGSRNGTWDEGTKGFKCGGPECADVNSYGAGEGTDTGFIGLDKMGAVSEGWAKNTLKGAMDQVEILAATLYERYKRELIAYDADDNFDATNTYKNLINENYLNLLINLGVTDAKIDDNDDTHKKNIKSWIIRRPINLYNPEGFNLEEYNEAVKKDGTEQTKVSLDVVDDYEVTKAFLDLILEGVPVPTTKALDQK